MKTERSIAVKRRDFLKQSSLTLAVAGALSAEQVVTAVASEMRPWSSHNLIGDNDVILFQGDSITDAGRNRDKAAIPNEQTALGSGYAWLAAVELLVSRPRASLKLFNRGISGNKVFELAARWQTDCIDLNPNLVSILIGVNDYWHTLDGKYHGTVEIYERDYRALLERTRKALPHARLVICEPFVLRCGAVNDKWFPQFEGYRMAAMRMAKMYHATFVPFQLMFDEAVKYAPPQHWANDGVHPTSAGASLMAHTWLTIVAGKG